jgi:hypothetical protein
MTFAAVLALLAIPLAAPAALAAEENRITVAGAGSVELEADIAYIYFGVSGRDATASAALDALSLKTDSVIAALRAYGVPGQDITTQNLDLRRTYRREGRRSIFTGYRASMTIKVETNETEEVGQIIDAGVDGGANAVRNVAFDVEDKRAAVNAALVEAMNNAEAKARTLAEAAGRTLGPALIIREGDTRAPRAINYGAVYGSSTGSAGGGSTAADLEIRPDTLDATARIQVTFELI